MKRFESGDVFKPAYQGQGFEPLQVADTTPLLRQNNQARLQEAKAFADQRMTDLKLEEQAVKYANLLENDQVERLADFSNTLSETLVAGAKLRNERVEQFYMMQAFTDGLPKEQTDAFDAQEKALEDGTSVVYNEAANLQAGGLSVEQVQKVRSLSGWAKYGYMRGLAMQGGQDYGTYFTNASTQMQVTVGDRTFTLAEANGSAERAAAKAAIAESYISQYRGMSPELLNKYLFEPMRDWEAKDDLAYAEKQRENFEETKKIELDNDIAAAALAGDGTAFIDSINLHAEGLGGRRIAIRAGLTKLRDMAKNGQLTRKQVDAILNSTTTRFDNGEEDTLANIFFNHIATLDFEGAYEEALNREYTRDENRRSREKQELANQIREELPKYLNEDGTVPVGFMKPFNQRYGEITGDYSGHPLFKQLKNDEEYNTEAQVEEMQKRMEQRPTPFLTVIEYAELTSEAKRKLGKIEIRDSETGLSTEQVKTLNRLLTGTTASELKMAGLSSSGDATRQGLLFQAALRSKFLDEYDKAIASGVAQSNTDAFLIAQAKMDEYAREKIKVTGANGVTVEKHRALVEQENLLKSRLNPKSHDISIRTEILDEAHGKNPLTEKIDGLAGTTFSGANTPLAALDKWIANGGKGKLPPIFRALAVNSGVEGASAWDVAAAQYEMHRDKKLAIPKVVQNVRKLSVEQQRLLVETPTPARTTRAALMSGGMEKFANLVGFHESKAHGGYDAMNKGGSGRGVNNRAVGSANSKELFGTGLSEMTVGEVLRRGQLHYTHPDFVFAAGRYQFIPKTLRWVVAREGIDLNQKFDKATQDFLFASQVRWRLSVHSGKSGIVQGLRDEWQGLHHASEQSILDGVEYFQGSPFNDPAYLHPGLLKPAGGDK